LRPTWLRRLLSDLRDQQTESKFDFEVVVADNDPAESARNVVQELEGNYPVALKYCIEPAKGIDTVRNKALQVAVGDFIVFIDDDEFPAEKWLLNLYNAWSRYGSAGVLGPVRPYFEQGAPKWVIKAGFYHRPEHETGFIMDWRECRTGNVLFERRILQGQSAAFSHEFATGGGDVEFFRKMMRAGHRFVWCNEAVVFEHVPLKRCRRAFLMKRALLRGRNSLRYGEGRALSIVKALIAVPLYALALPLLRLRGEHCFMRYLVKLCDHTGRLLGTLGITLVRERPM
jgi:glycosyltransferase involved in cell wall biosynthesis